MRNKNALKFQNIISIITILHHLLVSEKQHLLFNFCHHNDANEENYSSEWLRNSHVNHKPHN